MNEEERLRELVKSIKARCEIFLEICELPHMQKNLPTILEDIAVDSQTILDEHCVVDDYYKGEK